MTQPMPYTEADRAEMDAGADLAEDIYRGQEQLDAAEEAELSL